MKRGQNFKHVRTYKPPRSVFDLSYEKKFTCDMGQLIPVMCDEVVPGDFFKIANQSVVRFQPLVAPILHEVNVYTHYFFVPYRLLWPYEDSEDPGFEIFITGGEDGDDDSTIPTWEPTDYTEGSLWDYFGFPVGIDPTDAYPVDFPRRAYNFIWNEFYRDETLQDEVAWTNEDILLRNWEKDFFTSAQPNTQRGTSPALPIAGTTSAEFTNVVNSSPTENIGVSSGYMDDNFYVNGATESNNASLALNNNVVDLSLATTFDIADLRLAIQTQRFQERNQRVGVRYTEFLQAHFGVSPRDDRLDRPEYIGGTKSPVIVSEVLQTSETDTTPQGTLAGHGLNVGNGYVGKYNVQEYGLIIGIMSIMPKPAYEQGINRQWLKESRYDFFFPEFIGLSEQPVIRAELYASAVGAENQTVFGYQGRFDEMRVKQNQIVSEMRGDYDYWHISRQFGSAPSLNSDFIECDPRKDIFAAPSEPGMIVSFANLIQAFRPIPVIAEPGLIDHY
jgi:hypothetical protein